MVGVRSPLGAPPGRRLLLLARVNSIRLDECSPPHPPRYHTTKAKKLHTGIPAHPSLPCLPAVPPLVATKAAFDQGQRFQYEALRIRRGGLGVLRISPPFLPPPPQDSPIYPAARYWDHPGTHCSTAISQESFFFCLFCFFFVFVLCDAILCTQGASPGFGVANINLL